MLSYVTYDEDGNLTGAFLQELHPAHADCFLEVPDEVRLNWVKYTMDETRKSVIEIPPTPIDLNALAAELSAKVDNLVADIYAKPQRFIKEYEEREAQARSYLAALAATPEDSPAPEVPARIAGFAKASGLNAKAAAELTVSQADNLRNALGMLADLRMRKYEIKRATTEEGMNAVFADIATKALAIAKQIA